MVDSSPTKYLKGIKRDHNKNQKGRCQPSQSLAVGTRQQGRPWQNCEQEPLDDLRYGQSFSKIIGIFIMFRIPVCIHEKDIAKEAKDRQKEASALIKAEFPSISTDKLSQITASDKQGQQGAVGQKIP